MSQRKKEKGKRSAIGPTGSSRKLFFRDLCLGEITDVEGEFPWMSGTLQPAPAAEPFGAFFRWMTDEEHASQEPPFEADLLDDDNWFIQDEHGSKTGITVPAVYGDGLISWRWR
jgi:hypothetical protein